MPLSQHPLFKALQQCAQHMPTLAERFADNPLRVQQLTLHPGDDVLVDISRQQVCVSVLQQLCELARHMNLPAAIAGLFADNQFNPTEQRAVLHTALRMPAGSVLEHKGVNVIPAVHAELDKMRRFCQQVHSGKWQGYTGLPIKDVVNIGIGGSDLGPAMVCEALKPYCTTGIRTHFVSNIDPAHLAITLDELNPATTLFVVSSKSFGTDETMSNAIAARQWLLNACGDDSLIQQHFVAVSTNHQKVVEFGIAAENMFTFWDWVGGRFSLWSAIGLPIALAVGFERFEELLAGAHTMDEHLRTTPFEQNIPVLLALLTIWNQNVLGHASEGVFPYSQLMHRFPAFLQQLNMESNGKSVMLDGSPVSHATGPIVFGDVGSNSQHAFFQLLHQGTTVVPAEFIGFVNSPYDFPAHRHKLLANMLAQAEALAFGKSAAEVEAELRAEGLSEQRIAELLPSKVMPGNRPSTVILCKELTPHTLGSLIALYEHKTFVQGVLWGVNSFDQWGVELGKKLASGLVGALAGETDASNHDVATQNLIKQISLWSCKP
ncbi:glucose-6-phosphate isomerase [Oceanimonas baumannii]|uniref:glucose-6-phosphate isomerase n=1 Tax=Oceanimonas baumannii TaxID=129578 RepID=UPI001D17EC51|nr:glucose-6-phosphate isomerase [Oceanimonas baumannii]MCC4264627.1 glucose-6-phosphate isomerase [Oceanimonas baumannii]